MISKSASRDAKYSILTMVLSGFAVLGILFYAIDKLLFEGMFTTKIVQSCQGFGATCKNALLSGGWPPVVIVIVAFSAALVFAMLRAGLILFSSMRQTANFLEVSDAHSDLNTAELKRAFQELTGRKQSPEIKLLANEEPLAFTSGLFKPRIYLSQGLLGLLDHKELEAVILHESGHIQRKDNLAIFSMLFLRDFLFGLPLAHFLFRLYVREKENAADDYVVGEMEESTSLASAILKLSRLNHLKKDPSPTYATFFPSRATAQARITRLLSKTAPKRAREIGNFALAFAASVLMLLLLAGATYQASAAGNTNCARSGIVCQDGTICSGGNQNCCAQHAHE